MIIIIIWNDEHGFKNSSAVKIICEQLGDFFIF